MTIELFNQEFQGHVEQMKSYILRITASLADAGCCCQKVKRRSIFDPKWKREAKEELP